MNTRLFLIANKMMVQNAKKKKKEKEKKQTLKFIFCVQMYIF